MVKLNFKTSFSLRCMCVSSHDLFMYLRPLWSVYSSYVHACVRARVWERVGWLSTYGTQSIITSPVVSTFWTRQSFVQGFSLSLCRTKGDALSETESHFHTNISRPAVIFCFTPTIFCFSSNLLSIDLLFFLIVPDRLVKLRYQITRQICSIAIILNSEIN